LGVCPFRDAVRGREFRNNPALLQRIGHLLTIASEFRLRCNVNRNVAERIIQEFCVNELRARWLTPSLRVVA
jgi:hypothetical protein